METLKENYDQEKHKESSEYWEKMYSEFVDFRRLHPGGTPPQ
jgi:hypothetical protein